MERCPRCMKYDWMFRQSQRRYSAPVMAVFMIHDSSDSAILDLPQARPQGTFHIGMYVQVLSIV